MRWLILSVRSAFLTAAAIIPSNVHAQPSLGAGAVTNPQDGAFLDDAALRTLLSNVYVARPAPPPGQIISHRPGEIFRADGIYQRIVGRTSVWGRFEITGGSVCVWGADFARTCRRISANADGTYTFTDITSAERSTMMVTTLQ